MEVRVKNPADSVSAAEAAPRRSSWWTFIIIAVLFALAALLFMMVLHVLPTPAFLEPLVTAVRNGLGEFELTIMRRFMPSPTS